MFFFLLLIIPAVTFCTLISRFNFSKIHFPALMGISFALAITIVIEYFLTIEQSNIYSNIETFMHQLPVTAVPPLFFSIVIFLFSKDKVSYRSSAVLCASGCFFSILVPYMTIRSDDKNSLFMLFFNPILYAETIVLFHSLQNLAIYFSSRNRTATITIAFLSLAVLAIQPAVNTTWQLKEMGFLYMIATIALIPTSFLLNKISYKNINSLDTDM